MKFYKLLVGVSLAVLASISVNASAQTNICTWNSVYGSTDSYGNSTVTLICRIASGTVVASRQDIWYRGSSNYTCGTASVSAGYKKTGAREGSYYPLMCNDIIAVDNSTPPPVVTVYPGSSCAWAKTPSYHGYDYYDFNCQNYGKVATKTVGFPWSYYSQGYSCRISAVSPYKVESWTNSGSTSCDITKVTK